MDGHLSLHSMCISRLEAEICFIKQGRVGLSIGFRSVSVACVVAELHVTYVFLPKYAINRR